MNSDAFYSIFIISFLIGAFFAFFVGAYFIEKEPSAIEVYQGKTTLEYKIVDNQVIDSVVVYKNIYNK